MNREPSITRQISPANSFLWAVRCFIDLITREETLIYGNGLRRLYSLVNGPATLSDLDIIAITEKSEKMGLIPHNLYFFMMSSILKNCKFYGIELVKMIDSRIVDIANGDIVNPNPTLKYSPAMGRRYFYTPPIAFLQRLENAIEVDTFSKQIMGITPSASINDLAVDASMILSRMQITEGHIHQTESSWGLLSKLVRDLEYILISEATYRIEDQDYRSRARSALSILWVITKLLYGDLNIKPLPKDINLVDLNLKISMTDGTLAAIPFPIKQTMEVFKEEGPSGISMKGRMYLSAISAAAFYRNNGVRHSEV